MARGRKDQKGRQTASTWKTCRPAKDDPDCAHFYCTATVHTQRVQNLAAGSECEVLTAHSQEEVFGSVAASLNSVAAIPVLHDKCIKISFDGRFRGSRCDVVSLSVTVAFYPESRSGLFSSVLRSSCHVGDAVYTLQVLRLLAKPHYLVCPARLGGLFIWPARGMLQFSVLADCSVVISHVLAANRPRGLLQWCKQLKLEWAFKVPLYRVTKADVVSLARFPGEGPFFPQTTASGQQSPEDSSWLVASCESRVQNAQNPRSLRILFRGG